MRNMTGINKSHNVDSKGFLVFPREWTEQFAMDMAMETGIEGGLTDEHWKIIRFIRETYLQHGKVPLFHVTCVNHRLHLRDFKRLFPSGYHRGACRLAGISYRTEFYHCWVSKDDFTNQKAVPDKVYPTDVLGFLVDAEAWDEAYAANKALELKMEHGLSNKHWVLINFVRIRYKETRQLPTVIQTCEENGLEIEDLMRLFPDGYHRGLVKISGLRYTE